jgi:uncharacterized protein
VSQSSLPEVSPQHPSWRTALLIGVTTTAAVGLIAYLFPDEYGATGVGLAFLVATYWAALGRTQRAEQYGLALGGLLEPEPLEPKRLVSATLRALAWAGCLALVFFPPFWLGWLLWWQPGSPFTSAPLLGFADELLVQVFVIALPEEAFYRGYLQTALDDRWRRRWSVLGARLGPGWLLASAIFAFGHILTEAHPSRLAVFFPALVFGWLRAKTGGIGAPILFHAACNLFASYLARSYGLAG